MSPQRTPTPPCLPPTCPPPATLASTPGPRGALIINALLSEGPGEWHSWFCRSKTCQMQKDRCQNHPTPGHTLGWAYAAPDQETGGAKEQELSERRRGGDREGTVNRGGKENLRAQPLWCAHLQKKDTRSSRKSTAGRGEKSQSLVIH